jgi:glutamate N-acetyltransferase/amino-acid N-acetyltransferase
MPVGLKKPEVNTILNVPGIKLASVKAGIKYKDREDLSLILLDEGSVVSGLFTKNKFRAAPVQVCQNHLEVGSHKRALIINTGSANAGTGSEGFDNAMQICSELAKNLKVQAHDILPFSTGVILTHIPVNKIVGQLTNLIESLDESHWLDVAEAIMTTDTVPKAYSTKIKIENEDIVITGVSKGSGMICPNMATMLAFIGTNANISESILSRIHKEIVEDSFNAISVDGDTSTNDSFILMATNQAQNKLISNEGDKDYEIIKDGFFEVAKYLAHSIIRDGEGATKFIHIEVVNGKTKNDCKEIARKISHSPLVKTALFASDPNLGRILAAIGNADISSLLIDKVDVYLNGLPFAKNGSVALNYDEALANIEMKKTEIHLKVDLKIGSEHSSFWTTDLSYDYVKINAEYRS